MDTLLTCYSLCSSAVWYPPNNNANGLDKSEFGTNFVADESLHSK